MQVIDVGLFDYYKQTSVPFPPQGLSSTLRDCILNDDLMSLVCEACDKEKLQTLVDFCTKWLAWADEAAAQESMQTFFLGTCRDQTLQVFSELSGFARVVLCLCMVPGASWDGKVVTQFLEEATVRGCSMFKKSVAAALSPMATAAEDSSEVYKKSQKMWQALTQDCLRTVGSCAVLRPQMQTLMARLQHQDQECTPSLATLLEAAQSLKGFQTHLRRGEGKPFSEVLLKQLLLAVDQMTSCEPERGEGERSCVSSADLDSLEAAISSFGSKEDLILQAQDKLMHFATQHNKGIAQEDLKQCCAQFIEAREAQAGGADTHVLAAEQMTKLKDLMAKSGAGLRSDVKDQCVEAVKHGVMEILEAAASCQCLRPVMCRGLL